MPDAPTPTPVEATDRIPTPDGWTRVGWLRWTMNQWACWLERDEMMVEYEADLASFEDAVRKDAIDRQRVAEHEGKR